MSLHELKDEFNKAYDTITHNAMGLRKIANMDLLKKEYWIAFAGAQYPKGTQEQRIMAAIEAREKKRLLQVYVDRAERLV